MPHPRFRITKEREGGDIESVNTLRDIVTAGPKRPIHCRSWCPPVVGQMALEVHSVIEEAGDLDL
jgi:hypothetical protein